MKRFERPILGFLSREEMLAVLGAARRHLDFSTRPSAAGHALQYRGTGLGNHWRKGERCRYG
jgi:hypothetical protein